MELKSANQLRQTPSTDMNQLAKLCKALSHPIRIQIINFLKQSKQCICGDIVDHLPVAQSTVSQHLKILKEAGLIQGSIDGPRTCYCLDHDVLQRFKKMLKQM
jgi:DNA-binding transcriptional ArsR family regulator